MQPRPVGFRNVLYVVCSSEPSYVSDRSSIEAFCSANAAGRIQRQHVSEELSLQEDVDDTMSLQSGRNIHWTCWIF